MTPGQRRWLLRGRASGSVGTEANGCPLGSVAPGARSRPGGEAPLDGFKSDDSEKNAGGDINEVVLAKVNDGEAHRSKVAKREGTPPTIKAIKREGNDRRQRSMDRGHRGDQVYRQR